jgi:tRNA(Ile2) C34 agmatinyltransferase TiaS
MPEVRKDKCWNCGAEVIVLGDNFYACDCCEVEYRHVAYGQVYRMAMLINHGWCDDFIDHGAIHSPHPGADYALSSERTKDVQHRFP